MHISLVGKQVFLGKKRTSYWYLDIWRSHNLQKEALNVGVKNNTVDIWSKVAILQFCDRSSFYACEFLFKRRMRKLDMFAVQDSLDFFIYFSYIKANKGLFKES